MNMAIGVSAWEAARVSGKTGSEIKRGRELRNRYCQEYLMTEDIENEGVLQTLAELAGGKPGFDPPPSPPNYIYRMGKAFPSLSLL